MRLTKFELKHPNGNNKVEYFVEAQKEISYRNRFAILIICRNGSVLDVKEVHNLGISLQKHFANLNSENSYFYRCVNKLKRLEYHYILESNLVLA